MFNYKELKKVVDHIKNNKKKKSILTLLKNNQ